MFPSIPPIGRILTQEHTQSSPTSSPLSNRNSYGSQPWATTNPKARSACFTGLAYGNHLPRLQTRRRMVQLKQTQRPKAQRQRVGPHGSGTGTKLLPRRPLLRPPLRPLHLWRQAKRSGRFRGSEASIDEHNPSLSQQ
jgi:hypothetical protein